MKIWCQDYRDEHYVDAIMEDVRKLMGISLVQARSVAARFPRDMTAIVRSKRPPTDFFMAGPFPIISHSVKAILERHAVNAEYLTICLKLANNARESEKKAWYCLNVMESIACLDRTHSKYVAEQEFATDITQLVVKDETTGSAPLFRIAKTIPSIIGVRDDVASEITSARCTGVVFVSPENWTNPMDPIKN